MPQSPGNSVAVAAAIVTAGGTPEVPEIWRKNIPFLLEELRSKRER